MSSELYNNMRIIIIKIIWFFWYLICWSCQKNVIFNLFNHNFSIDFPKNVL